MRRLVRLLALLIGLAALAPLPGLAQEGARAPGSTSAQQTPPGTGQGTREGSGVGSNAATDRGIHLNPQRMPTNDEQRLRQILGDERMPDGNIDGWTYTPNSELRHVVQPYGRTWRDFRVGGSRWTHGILIALAVLAVVFLIIRVGPQTYEQDPQGRRILRFRAVDRFIHWLTAVSFVLLALTGLNIVFGRLLIQPLIGDGAFGALTRAGLIIHNNVGFAFLTGLLVMAVMWMRDNLFRRVDLYWFRRGGGLLSGEHVPAEKFNAGQKGIYWLSLAGGLALGVTGILLLLPIANLGVNGMQILHAAHTIVAALFIALIIGHIYLGSVGVQGSFSAMSRGDVDLEWARVHHPIWVERSLGRDEPPPGAVVTPVELRRGGAR